LSSFPFNFVAKLSFIHTPTLVVVIQGAPFCHRAPPPGLTKNQNRSLFSCLIPCSCPPSFFPPLLGPFFDLESLPFLEATTICPGAVSFDPDVTVNSYGGRNFLPFFSVSIAFFFLLLRTYNQRCLPSSCHPPPTSFFLVSSSHPYRYGHPIGFLATRNPRSLAALQVAEQLASSSPLPHMVIPRFPCIGFLTGRSRPRLPDFSELSPYPPSRRSPSSFPFRLPHFTLIVYS